MSHIDDRYSSDFSEHGFWKTLLNNPSLNFIEEALALWYCLCDPDTSMAAKAMIVAALGYFICPIDAVPDAIPIVGWLDDAGVIALAVKALSSSITGWHRDQAHAWLRGNR